MAGELAVIVVAQPAEVDDLLDSSPLGGGPEGLGRSTVLFGEIVGVAHRVHEVVRRPDSLHGRRQRIDVGHVAGHDLDPLAPLDRVELRRRTSDAPHRVPGVEQLGNEATPDVAGGAGDEDSGCRHGHTVCRDRCTQNTARA